MTTKIFFSKIGSWLQSTEMFERPRKKLPGEWQLFEYFSDKGEKLIHIQEEQLQENKETCEITFSENNFVQKSNFPIPVLHGVTNSKWSVAKNFVILIDESNFRNNLEFQFAFEKGNLKLLKRDAMGKIEFFGFFKKLN